jgi:hypothetical protein
MLRCCRSAFELVKEPLHSGLFTRRGVFFDYTFAGGGVDLFDHIHKGGFRLIHIPFPGKSHKFFGARPDRAFYRFVADAPFFALPVPFFGGTYLACQMKTPTLIFLFIGPVRKPGWLPRRPCPPAAKHAPASGCSSKNRGF